MKTEIKSDSWLQSWATSMATISRETTNGEKWQASMYM